MPNKKVKKGLTFLIYFLALFTCLFVDAQSLNFKIAGDKNEGYTVDIYSGGKLLVTGTEEFSIHIFNTDLSAEANIQHWKGAYWTGDEHAVTLTKETYIKEFDANLSVAVHYVLVNANTVKKTVELMQPSMPGMLYMLEQTARPAEKPSRYVTFEYDSFPGGMVHEMFPSAGFVTKENQVVGFLTDAGYRNQYTRNTRRRFSGRGGGFVGMRKLPDPNLFSVADYSERAQNNDYIRQTYGELYNLDAGSKRQLNIPVNLQKEGNADITTDSSMISISGHGGVKAGFSMILPFKDQQIYTISFQCKGNTPLALKLFRIKNGQKTIELEDGIKYIDNFPATTGEWTEFKGSILVPFIEHDSVTMFIGSQSGKECQLQIKDLQIAEHHAQREAYNVLPLGEKICKTSYLFVEPWVSHQQYMISSQLRLAEGKGFKGSPIEKMLYANFNMLTWITDINDFTAFNVPNMNYAPDMYNRDSYFSTVASYNKALNISLWNQWSKTQTAKGSIGTIITPLMGSVEAKDNEATIEWLIWAMLNKRRFGVVLPQAKIKLAVNYVLNALDETGDGICRSHFSLSQVDIIDYNPKTDRLAVNQGMLAIALRTIKELGFAITEAHIQKAENAYRGFYDLKRKHLLFDRNFPDIISLTDLEPEFFSLWLFKKPILTDEMVQNHLEQIPHLNKSAAAPYPQLGTTAPICVRKTHDEKGYAYLSADYQPFEKFGQENYSDGKSDGFYYNGGSWFRAEYCAYVTGLKHHWKKAKPFMENRVWAEIYLNPKWPFSKEFIPTKYASLDSWWPSSRGLCWNVFILMADELAGLRTADMDPDYKKN